MSAHGRADAGGTVIVVPDATRPIEYAAALQRPLMQHPDALVLVGLGLHRQMTKAELAPLKAVCAHRGLRWKEHDPDACERAPSGAALAPELVRASRIVCVGIVEPHQYAGFSGGVKGIAIGCGSRDLIAEMHGLPMLRACGAKVGWLDGNPFQERLWEICEGLAPIDGHFIVPAASADESSQTFEGPVREAFTAAVSDARNRHFWRLDAPVRSMLLKVPPAKSASFYQASRAATYVALARNPAIAEGGTLYVEAACPEGIGLGSGERSCAAAMAAGPEALLAELEDEATVPARGGGAQRAYVLAMALRRAKIVLVGAGPIPELRAMGIRQESSPAVVELVVEAPFHRLPVVGG